MTTRWHAAHPRSRLRRTLRVGGVLGVAMVLQMLLMPDTSVSAAPVCETALTTLFDGTFAFETDPVSVSCSETFNVTSLETTIQTNTETTTVPTTQTTTVPTTETVLAPTTLEIPTTVGVPVHETTTTTEQGAIVGTTFTEHATTTETNTVNVTWGYAATVNPATNMIPAVSLSAPQVSPGDTLAISVIGFTPGETVQIWLHSAPVLLGEVTAGADGSAQTSVTIPLDTEAGQHVIQVVGLTCGIEASIPLTVVAAASPAPGGGQPGTQLLDGTQLLSSTGMNTQPFIVIAAVLIAAGTSLALLARRTRRQIPAIAGAATIQRSVAPASIGSGNEPARGDIPAERSMAARDPAGIRRDRGAGCRCGDADDVHVQWSGVCGLYDHRDQGALG